MDLVALLSALLMGVVEGLTEFLPISSTGHLILIGDLIGFRGPPGKAFEISIQLGAIMAVVWIYRRMLWSLARGWRRPGRARDYVTNIVLAFLPAMVLGATLHGTITGLLFTPWVVSVALVVGGVAIILIEWLRPAPTIESVPEIGPLAALLIGVDRRTAAEFSFILAIPTMLAATAFSLFKARHDITSEAFDLIAVGFLTAFVVALVTVRAVLAVISRTGFAPFGWYRIALGALMLAVLSAR